MVTLISAPRYTHRGRNFLAAKDRLWRRNSHKYIEVLGSVCGVSVEDRASFFSQDPGVISFPQKKRKNEVH